MKQMNAFCGKITAVEVVDVAVCKVTFSNGGKHQMSNNPALKVGAIVAIDGYGSIWVKS